MKKTFLILGLIMSGAVVFAQQAVIREVSGTVEVKASGASAYTAANPGDRVAEDTVVSTGFKSTALIEAESVVVIVRPLTKLTLTEIRSAMGEETLNVNLAAGRVHLDVSPPAGTRASVGVSSPTATASVRGTEFEMDTRRVVVVEGRVDFSGRRGGLVIVDGGHDSSVLTDGRASNPQGSIIAGFRPTLPVGYDRYSASGGGSGPAGFYVPANTPSTPSQPGSPSTPSQPGSPSGPSGPSSGPSGPSGPPGTTPGTGNDGGGGITVDYW